MKKNEEENILKEEGKETHKPEGLTPKVETVVQPKMRQIVISTDGDNIHLNSADVSGRIELIAILENLTNFLKKK